MITSFQAAVLGALQGVTELFPISSLGHSILLPALVGWRIDNNSTDILEFLVATHFATALTLFFVYRSDWFRIIKGIFRSLKAREIAMSDLDARLGWLLIVGTIPAGITGLLFDKALKNLFVAPRAVAIFLVVNGAILAAAELLRRRRAPQPETETNADERLGTLSWMRSLKIGCMQVLALVPGISRTGATMTGGLWVGLSHEDALRFSFLLATPVIGAAALLELPGLQSAGAGVVQASLVGAVTAAAGAYFSVKFLVRYFKTRTLLPFAIYCAAIGLLGLLLLA